jgi:hypothetical protein
MTVPIGIKHSAQLLTEININLAKADHKFAVRAAHTSFGPIIQIYTKERGKGQDMNYFIKQNDSLKMKNAEVQFYSNL